MTIFRKPGCTCSGSLQSILFDLELNNYFIAFIAIAIAVI